MKRFLVVISAVAMLLVSGCRKEESGLAGTKWVADDEKVNATLSFTSIRASLGYPDATYYYSYEYADPVVVLRPEATDDPVLEGTISGNQMTLINTSTNSTVGFFTRK